MKTPTWVGLVLSATLVAGSAQAQDVAHSFDELQRLVKPGATILISDSTAHQLEGRIAELSASALVVVADGKKREFHAGDVATIQQRRQDSLLNGTLIGAAIGAGLGIMGGVSCENDFGCGGSVGEFLALWGSIGAGVGAGVDALIVKPRTIYQTRPDTRTSLKIAPMLGNQRQGLLASLRF